MAGSYPVKIVGTLILVSISFLAVIAGTMATVHVSTLAGIAFMLIGVIVQAEVMHRCDEYLERNRPS